jgi:hypothetical protein
MNKEIIPNTETITYHDQEGRITGSVTATLNTIDANKVGLWVNGFGDRSIHYVKDGVITDRPEQKTTLEGSTLKNLPVPCQIHINGEVYECDEDHAELEIDLPGTYQISVTAWPYLDVEFTYENQSS